MKYRALRTIAVIFKVFGWITLVLGVLSSCGAAVMMIVGGMASISALAGTSTDASAATGLLSGGIAGAVVAVVALIVGLIFTGVYALLLFAFAEGISVFLDIEQNTRLMAEQLRR